MKMFLMIFCVFFFHRYSISLEDDLIVRGLPGQPLEVSFKQYSGSITVNEDHERSLFYYFVEAHHAPFSKPLLLWLNGGPGCSSLGVGAMVEHGPFGVKEDGKTLYSRRHSWNKVANILYLESPAGVGFSYSNCSSDYNTTGDSRTARDSYVFLVKWFEKFPHFKTSDFYIAGESYAGFFIPELADTILDNMHSHPSSIVQLKGIMIGNGLMNYATDMRGMYDYIWSHALMSKETHKGLLDNCIEPISLACSDFQDKWNHEMGYVDLSSLNSEPCSGTSSNFSLKGKCGIDPCEKNYVSLYLNLPYVQEALHANKTNLPYPWALCNLLLNRSWWDSPSSMLTIYRKLIAARLRILLYSGDMDGIIPWMSTQYSIAALNLTVKSPWKPWMDATNKVGGYRVEYEGLIFSTVRGAGHEVPRLQPQRAFSLLKWFLEGM